LFKDKKSKFWGYAIPLNSEAELKMFIGKLKTSHHNANHFCYAWQIGVNPPEFRYNDDGEPNNTAGAPIYGQIQSFELTQIGIVVLRIFGGVKLGPGGLISAYKAAAKGALELSNIISVSIKIPMQLKFPYTQLHLIMRIIKREKIHISKQEIQGLCVLEVQVPVKLEKSFKINISKVKDCLVSL
jgi:uncharacterized YigZ family protein